MFALSLTSLGKAHLQSDNTERALGFLRRGLATYEAAGEVRSESYGFCHAAIGDALRVAGRTSEALTSYTRGLDIVRTQLPADHPRIADLLRKVSQLHARLGNVADASASGAAATAARRRSQLDCAGPGCKRKLREDGTPLDQCAGCLRTYYCSVTCQRADWKAGHKAECKALAAVGVGAGTGDTGGGGSAKGGK